MSRVSDFPTFLSLGEPDRLMIGRLMIREPTRITDKSSTLLDLCVTNSPVNVVASGVLHLSISDHSLVYMVRKAHYKRNGARIVEVRSLKKFNRQNFLRDLELKQ